MMTASRSPMGAVATAKRDVFAVYTPAIFVCVPMLERLNVAVFGGAPTGGRLRGIRMAVVAAQKPAQKYLMPSGPSISRVGKKSYSDPGAHEATRIVYVDSAIKLQTPPPTGVALNANVQLPPTHAPFPQSLQL